MNASRRSARAETLPIIPLRSTTVYPLGVIGVQIGIPTTLELLSQHPEAGLIAAVVVAEGGPDEPVDPKSLAKIGVRARVSDRLNLPGGTVQLTLQGVERISLSDIREHDGYYVGTVSAIEEQPIDEAAAQELIARILNALEILSSEVERVPREVPRILRMNLADPGRFTDLVATLSNFSVQDKDAIVQRVSVQERLAYALCQLDSQLGRVRQIASDEESHTAEPDAGAPQTPAEQAADLRQRIKMMQSQLGDIDPLEREVIDSMRRIEVADMPALGAAAARTEVERLRSVGGVGPEASEIRSYVDWLIHLPWRNTATDGPEEIDLGAVETAMNDALLGLDEQKERLLDHLAVAKLRGDLRGPIPCIVGPPDVGKSSLVAALARGLGRPLARVDLGGRGEAQLIGTRRTRTGAQPGKIVGALRDVAYRDPLIMLQEMDEIGLGKVEGDPIEAMEEVLDWENRVGFVDRYIDLPVDISDVMFIAIAQDFYRVPRDLRELMVEIRIAGYTPEEKLEIARQKLLPQLISEHGLTDEIEFSDEGLSFLAYGYARDAGVAMLRRSLETLLRTRARARTAGDDSLWMIDPERIEEILGLPRYTPTPAESSPEVGVVTGLAWTAAGGELMFIEALRMPGSGRLIITGMLGEVMRESVNAAYSYVRSRGEELRITEEGFRESDIHVHFPVGAIPKDGPSAGIAVTLAIASTLSNRPVRHDIAMTGEVTLRGKVLEIGGVKEKVLAAHRAGLRDVILPRGNERDLREVPEGVREGISFHFVERMDEVIQLALFNGRASVSKPAKRASRSRSARAARHKED
ncbi:MAG: LON peptidase substrate-binding domain-containing protein [Gemmatimonadetes bacterium]|nr:LON peptidase substrate-binding domain-containing protein [Gemmatimonadota bacterium]